MQDYPDRSGNGNGGGQPQGQAGVRHKIHSLETLGQTAEQWRASGQTVALCHGVFDVLHIGHLKHLEAARGQADRLFVTITADHFVRKGPGRPYFPGPMRAEMLAGLEYVDGVAIVEADSAVPAIAAVRPDVYVKGADYQDPNTDVTGKIVAERQEVERWGGKLHHTTEITYSSSTLINNFFAEFDPALRNCREEMRASGAADRLNGLVDGIANLKVLFVGDTIIDEYVFVSSLGKSSKENIIATLAHNREQYAGGIVAAAKHLASFCSSVEILTMFGSDNDFRGLVQASIPTDVVLNSITVDGRSTTRKTRFVDRGYTRKLFEVYDMDDRPLGPEAQANIDRLVSERVREADVVVVCDFGHGMLAGSTIDILQKEAKFLAVNVQSNAGNQGFNLVTKFRRADLICIDAPEARLAVAEKFKPIEAIVSETLPDRIDCPYFIVTHGIYGCYTWRKGEPVVHVPAFTNTVVDTVGAGDAFFAIAAPLVAIGGAPRDVGFVANAAGAIKVGVVGHRTSVERVNVLKYLTALLK